MGCRAAVGVVLGMVVGSGCLLTSDFDGIAEGSSSSGGSSSSSSSGSAAPGADATAPGTEGGTFVYAPFVASSCTGHSICLTFDDDDAGALPAGWSTTVSTDASLGRSAAASVSAPYGLAAQLGASEGGEGDAFLVRALGSGGQPFGQLAWGYSVLLTGCAGTSNGAATGSITVAGVGPTSSAAAGVVLGVTADYLSLVAAGESKLIELPARLPRDAWTHLDFALVLGQSGATATTLSVRVNSVPILTASGAAVGSATAPVLNVGVLATYPASSCGAVFDDYYFDGS